MLYDMVLLLMLPYDNVTDIICTSVITIVSSWLFTIVVVLQDCNQKLKNDLSYFD